jgi:hypothetical protein
MATRMKAAAMAALATAGLGASPAGAGYGDNQWCTNYAWEICTWEDGHQVMPTAECLEENYEYCMYMGWGGSGYYTRR